MLELKLEHNIYWTTFPNEALLTPEGQLSQIITQTYRPILLQCNDNINFLITM